MVVRSNGCFACKKRRIKCDQARPYCRRCVIHRIQCPGYASDSDNPINIVVYASTTISPGSDSSSTSLGQIDPRALERIQFVSSASYRLVPFGEKPAVPLDLLDIAGFNAVQIRQPALEAAINALALVQIGTTSKDPTVLVNAQRDYGRSLRLLSQYIRYDPYTPRGRAKVWDDQIASAVVVLKYCESFEPLQHRTATSAHHLGLRSFYLDRGPVPLKNAAESFLFCQARTIILSGSLIQRQRCFLEESEWLRVSGTAPGRDAFFDLQDVAARLPGLVELADQSMSNDGAKKDVIAQLEAFVTAMDDFATLSGPTVTYDAESSQHWLLEEPGIGRSYSFPDWRSTNLYCTWIMIRLYALLELQRLQSSTFDSERSPAEIRSIRDVEANIEESIENVCRSIPAQIGLQPRSLGTIASLTMLPMAAKLLEARGRIAEAKWCKDVWQKLRRQGFSQQGL